MRLVARLGEKYQVDELAAKYAFTGRTPMTVPQALEIKEELETIDRLLKQLEEAAKTAQIGIIDLDELSQFTDPARGRKAGSVAAPRRRADAANRRAARARAGQGWLSAHAQAYRLFQGRLLDRIFSQLEASRSGRHQGPIVGEGAVELQQTKGYEFGDSVANMDMPGSFTNALVRGGPGLPIRLKPEDIEIHRTRNSPKCATVVLADMSGSMRYDGQYIHVKRMALALDGLVRREYPGDSLQFIEMYTFAKRRRAGEIAALMPKPVTVFDPVVRLSADMSREDISEYYIPPHFTNIQHALQRPAIPVAADTPNRQIILITDGLPTAHFEGSTLFMLYPPDPRTEQATLRRGCFATARGSRSTSFCFPVGRNRTRTCSLPSVWHNRRPAGSFSPAVATSTGLSSGTMCSAAARSSPERGASVAGPPAPRLLAAVAGKAASIGAWTDLAPFCRRR